MIFEGFEKGDGGEIRSHGKFKTFYTKILGMFLKYRLTRNLWKFKEFKISFYFLPLKFKFSRKNWENGQPIKKLNLFPRTKFKARKILK